MPLVFKVIVDGGFVGQTFPLSSICSGQPQVLLNYIKHIISNTIPIQNLELDMWKFLFSSCNRCVWLACHQAWPSPKYVHSVSPTFLRDLCTVIWFSTELTALMCVLTGYWQSLCAHVHLLSHFPSSLTEPYNLQAIWNILVSSCRT